MQDFLNLPALDFPSLMLLDPNIIIVLFPFFELHSEPVLGVLQVVSIPVQRSNTSLVQCCSFARTCKALFL